MPPVFLEVDFATDIANAAAFTSGMEAPLPGTNALEVDFALPVSGIGRFNLWFMSATGTVAPGEGKAGPSTYSGLSLSRMLVLLSVSGGNSRTEGLILPTGSLSRMYRYPYLISSCVWVPFS